MGAVRTPMAGLCLALLCTSCASVVAGSREVLARKRAGYPISDTDFWDSMKPARETVTVQSKPEHASVDIYDRRGQLITRETTPASVSLNKGRQYFRGAGYRVTVSKFGYESQTVNIRSWPDLPWYLVGNFVVGGAVGWLAMDPYTGAMWNLVPSRISVDLKMLGLEKSVMQAGVGTEPAAAPVHHKAADSNAAAAAVSSASRKPAVVPSATNHPAK